MSTPGDCATTASWHWFLKVEPAALVSRSTIVILSAVLLGMGAGHEMHGDVATICGYAGLLGVAAYCATNLVAHQRHAAHVSAVVDRVHQRLTVSAQPPATGIEGPPPVIDDGHPTGATAKAVDYLEIATDVRRRRDRRRSNRTRCLPKHARPH